MAASSRSSFPRVVSFALVASLAFLANASLSTLAMPDAIGTVRADAPDRRWSPVTAADGGLAGAGLATDPASSAYANPALSLVGETGLRLSGFVMNPNRDDLRASTIEYEDANGFVGLGEVAWRGRAKGLGVAAYFSQPHYEHGESRFIGFNPSTGGGGDPFPRLNEFTSATRYAGASVALRLGSGAILGAGLEAALIEETYSSVPEVSGGTVGADTIDIHRSAPGFGGSLGVAYPFAGTWTIGAAFHAASSADDDPGSDEAPLVGLLGVKYGRTAGSQVHAGYRYLGARDLDLGEPGVEPSQADARSEFALGYAYLDPEGSYSFRVGAAMSPRPSDEALKLTRFGVALGLGGEGLRGSLGYSHESESRAGDRNSSRNLVLATVELTK
jgi:hypothetical protein